MRWRGNRSVSYSFRRVAWPSMEETDEYSQVTGGSVEYAELSRLKETGSFEYAGDPPDPHDLLRVYATFREEGGGEETAMLCTHMVEADSASARPYGSSGSVRTYSVLKALESDVVGFPLTVPAGTVAVARAREVCEAHGLSVEASPSGYALASDHTFDAGDDCLEVVNWLLGAAGFGSAAVTRAGAVRMAPYVEPGSRPPSFSFEVGEASVLRPEVGCGSDWAGSPNTVRCYHAGGSAAILATAVNADPASPASTVSRRRAVSSYEEVGELAGGTAAEMRAELEAIALRRLADASAEVEYRTVRHPFCGFLAGAAVEVAVPEPFSGAAVSMRVSLDAETACTTKVRRFARRNLETTVESEVLWEKQPEQE